MLETQPALRSCTQPQTRLARCEARRNRRENSELVVYYDEACYESLLKKYAEDIRIAQTLTLGGADLRSSDREAHCEGGSA